MSEGVVVSAEQLQVPERGRATVGPMPDVMGVAPTVGSVAAWMLAMPVAGDERSAHWGRDDPSGPSDVDRFRVRSEHNPTDGAVAGISPKLFGREDVAIGGLVGTATMATQSIKVGQHQNVGLLGSRRLTTVEIAAGEIGQSVGPPLPGGPWVPMGWRWGSRSKGSQDEVTGNRV
jgi:hypothetical protein